MTWQNYFSSWASAGFVAALVSIRPSRARLGEIQRRLLGCLPSSPCVPKTRSSEDVQGWVTSRGRSVCWDSLEDMLSCALAQEETWEAWRNLRLELGGKFPSQQLFPSRKRLLLSRDPEGWHICAALRKGGKSVWKQKLQNYSPLFLLSINQQHGNLWNMSIQGEK